MRTLGRRAAIGVTSVALVLAAAGSSLAAVRAARDDGPATAAGSAAPAPSGTRTGPILSPPVGDPVAPDGSTTSPPGPSEPGVVPGPDGSDTTPSTTPAGEVIQGPSAGTGQPGGASRQPGRRTTGISPQVTPAPAIGPTPTTMPSRPLPTLACPSNSGRGAPPPRSGPLQAVDFVLPWRGAGPMVMAPQASAARPAGAAVRITRTSVGTLAGDGSSLALPVPVPLVAYTLTSGNQTDAGTLRFTTGVPVNLERQACRGRSMALYDVERASPGGSPLRIVGTLALTATVTIGGDGGIAHFTAADPGLHDVLLVTANDAGAAGPLLSVTVRVS